MRIVEAEIHNITDSLVKDQAYVFFVAPNYEDRSLGLLAHLLKIQSSIRFEVVLLKLQSQSYRVDLLDDLKVNLYNRALKLLKGNKIKPYEFEIAYPDRYNHKVIEHLKRTYVSPQSRVVFDFSSLPKSVIIDICTVFWEAEKPFSFTYTSPVRYPKIRHPQAIGEMNGMVNHKPVGDLLELYSNGTLITFPSDLGYSGQLVSDQVAKHSRFEQYLFIYMRRRSPAHSFDAMAGNSNLLNHAYKDWRNNVINHFSIQDAFRKLKSIVAHIILKVPQKQRSSYLVLFAPFGPKPIIVSCLILLKQLADLGFPVDIVQESSFQYSSVYSIGTGKTYFFDVVPDPYAEG